MKGIALVVIFSFLLLGVAIPVYGQPASSPTDPTPAPGMFGGLGNATEPPNSSLESQLTETRKIAEANRERLETWLKRFTVWGTVASVLLAIAGFFGYSFLSNKLRALVISRLDQNTKAAVAESLPGILIDAQRNAEAHLLNLAELLALRSSGAFDEALAEYGWSGSVAELRSKSPLERRALIECLHGSRRNRAENRDDAWKAVTELSEEDKTLETARLYLRLAVSQRKYAEGLRYFEHNRPLILTDIEAGLRSSTLLRKLGRTEDALEVAGTFADSGDLGVSLTIAVLERDQGKFAKVHDLLLPHVNRLVKLQPHDFPEYWARVINTFVANCIDRRKPEDAVQAAKFMLKHKSGSVMVFTAGRLVLDLNENHPEREVLSESLKAAAEDLIQTDEAAIQCRVLIHRLDGRISDAIREYREAIDSAPLEKGRRMPPNQYFFRCNLAALLVDEGKTSDAIEELLDAAEFKYNGEAKYQLAIAYAMRSEAENSGLWLRKAIDELPKWAEHARDHPILRDLPAIQKVLAAHAENRL